MIGVLGGTFDPIHHGHLRVALDVKEALKLSEVRFVPLRTAVHRKQPVASAEQRYRLIESAIADQPEFVADDCEMLRDAPSYTLHTLQSLREKFPAAPLCLMVGGDAYNGFLSWFKPDEILQLAHVVVMSRPGYALPADPALQRLTLDRLVQNPAGLHSQAAGRILFVPVTQLEISASDIRQRIGAGKDPRYLLPQSCLELIRQENLYRRES